MTRGKRTSAAVRVGVVVLSGMMVVTSCSDGGSRRASIPTADAAGESPDPVFGVEAGAVVLALLPVDPAQRDEAFVLTDSSALDAVACAKETRECLRLRALLAEHFVGGENGRNASAFDIRGGRDASTSPVIPEYVLKGDETRLYVTVVPYERLLKAEVRTSESADGMQSTTGDSVANGHHDGRGAELSGTCDPTATSDTFTDPQQLPGSDPVEMGDRWATATALFDDGSYIASACVK